MIKLQTTEQIHSVLTWNDATIAGILIALVLASFIVIYYLFKSGQEKENKNIEKIEKLYQDFTSERDKLYKEHISEIKNFNELLRVINNQYYESIKNLVDFQKK